jgi:hypothetical protein
MRVIEAGQQQLSTGIDHLCASPAPHIRIRVRTDRDNAITQNRNGLCDRESLVTRPHFRVPDHQIRGRFQLSLTVFRQEGTG